jgi:hypothetical protein
MPAIASPWSLSNYAQAPSDNVSLGLGGQSIGKISPLVQGQKAPFDGVLLDAAAAAKLMVDQQTASQKCEIEIEKEVATEKAKLQLDLENTRAAKEALEKELDVRISLKNEHIEFLEKEAQKNEKKANNGKWWLIGGMAIGIALTIGGAFIIREVQRDIQPIVINTGI